ncbi:MAG: hypothetical protein ACRBCJ_11205 [Hyphomicrobiaceae bacterium]
MPITAEGRVVAHISGVHEHLLLEYIVELVRASNALRLKSNGPHLSDRNTLCEICDEIDSAIDTLKRFACKQDNMLNKADVAFHSLYMIAVSWPQKDTLCPTDEVYPFIRLVEVMYAFLTGAVTDNPVDIVSQELCTAGLVRNGGVWI